MYLLELPLQYLPLVTLSCFSFPLSFEVTAKLPLYHVWRSWTPQVEKVCMSTILLTEYELRLNQTSKGYWYQKEVLRGLKSASWHRGQPGLIVNFPVTSKSGLERRSRRKSRSPCVTVVVFEGRTGLDSRVLEGANPALSPSPTNREMRNGGVFQEVTFALP